MLALTSPPLQPHKEMLVPKGFKMVGRSGYLRKENGHSVDDTKKNGNGNGNGNGSNGNGNGGEVSESKSGDSSLRDWFGKINILYCCN